MLLLSIASYYDIEKPLRYNNILWSLKIWQFYAAFTVVLGLAMSCSVMLRLLKPLVALTASADVQTWCPYSMPPTTPGDCRIVETVTVSGNDTKFFTIRTEGCSKIAPALFVIGDSHAGAYIRAVRRIAAEDGRIVHLSTRGCCRLLPGPQMGSGGDCKGFLAEAVAFTLRTGVVGDVLFLPALYLRRYRAQHGSILTTASLATSTTPDDIERGRSYAAILDPVLAKGLTFVLQAPKPMVVAALYQCAD